MLRKYIPLCLFLLCCAYTATAQIEINFVQSKNFGETGFGAFLNFAFPLTESDYLAVDGGFQYFQNAAGEDLGLLPVLLGYRYTLDRSGSGFYIEPNAGYTFGSSTIGKYTDDGEWEGDNEQVSGPSAGLTRMYLVSGFHIPSEAEKEMITKTDYHNFPSQIISLNFSS